MEMFNMPWDAQSRPELAPLLAHSARPGDFIGMDDDKEWCIVRFRKFTWATRRALAVLSELDPPQAKAAEPDPSGQYARINRYCGAGKEPYAYSAIRQGCSEEEAQKKRMRLQGQVARIRAKVREAGKPCAVCGEHFKPRRIDQVRCSACIQKGKARNA